MEDTKSFRVRQLQYDCSNIGTTLKMLEFLKPRYAEMCVEAEVALKALKVLLVEDGIAGYLPKIELIAVQDMGDGTLELIPTPEELVEDFEALRLLKEEADKKIEEAELIAKEAEAKADKIAKLKETIKELEV